jgi:hypothetical protein
MTREFSDSLLDEIATWCKGGHRCDEDVAALKQFGNRRSRG